MPVLGLGQKRLGSFHLCLLGTLSWHVKKREVQALLLEARGHVEREALEEERLRGRGEEHFDTLTESQHRGSRHAT